MRSSLCLTIAVLALAACGPAAGGEEPASSRPRQDQPALETLDRADALVYSPKRAGLRDIQYRHEQSFLPNLYLEVRWLAPDHRSIRVVTAPDAPEHVRQMAELKGDELRVTGSQGLDMVIGKESRATYAEDEIQHTPEGQVRIVARAPDSRRVFQENLVSFDQQGLPISMRSLTPGGVLEMEVSYRRHGELFLVDQVSSRTPAGEALLQVRYQEMSGFLLPSEIVSQMGGTTTTQTFSDFRVNQGLQERDF